jgi:hypothetical protein
VTHVRETRSPKKSTTRASLELQVPQKTLWNIFRKCSRMFPYRLQLLQNLSENDKILRHSFCMDMQQRSEKSDDFFDRLIFDDESILHISGTVNKHNVRIWGTETPRAVVEHVRDSPKVNVFFCAVSRKVYGPFFFQEKKTVRGITYLDMLREWLMYQLKEDQDNFTLVQDGAPPHWHLEVINYLDEKLPCTYMV